MVLQADQVKTATRPRGGTPSARPPRRRRRNRIPYSLLFPGFVLLLVLLYIPMVLAGFVSLTSLDQYSIGSWLTAPFVGPANYLDALSTHAVVGKTFLTSIRASLTFAILTSIIVTPIGVGTALLLNSRLHARGALRALFLVPYVMPLYVSGIVWRLMFQNEWGAFDRLLKALHLSDGQTYWLLGHNAFWALIIAEVWSAWPFVYMMSLAGLQSIPPELYEAARIDGAGWYRRFRHVTLPLLWPSLSLALLFSTMNHLNNFTLPYVMFGPNPPSSASVMPIAIYSQSFSQFNFGIGAAMSIVSMVIMLVPAVLYIRATRLSEES